MPVKGRFCPTCGLHKVHKAWQILEDGTWHQYDSSRCHSDFAKQKYRTDKTGGVPVGLMCWDCAGRHWIPIQVVEL